MAIHPKDHASDNPRLQCSVCRRWMRLHGKRLEAVNGKVEEVSFQRFFGGCPFTQGDHLAGDKTDVCHACCEVECKKLAKCDCQNPEPKSGVAGVSEGCPIHGALYSTAPH